MREEIRPANSRKPLHSFILLLPSLSPHPALHTCVCFLSVLCNAELISGTSVDPFRYLLYIQSQSLNLIGVCMSRVFSRTYHGKLDLIFRNKSLIYYVDRSKCKAPFPFCLSHLCKLSCKNMSFKMCHGCGFWIINIIKYDCPHLKSIQWRFWKQFSILHCKLSSRFILLEFYNEFWNIQSTGGLKWVLECLVKWSSENSSGTFIHLEFKDDFWNVLSTGALEWDLGFVSQKHCEPKLSVETTATSLLYDQISSLWFWET